MTREKTPHQFHRSNSTPDSALLPDGPLGLSSQMAFLCFVLVFLLLAVAPFYFSGLWQAAIDSLGGDALVPQMSFLFTTAVACLLFALSGLGSLNQRRSALSVVLVAFLFWCALSTWSSVYKHDAFVELARLAALVAWFFLSRTLLQSQSTAHAATRRTALISALILGADLVCGIALWNFFFSPDPNFKHNPRQFSTFFNPNLLANYCAMVLPLGLTLLVKSRTKILPSLVTAASLLIISGGLAITSSKGGFLSALLGLLTFGSSMWHARSQHIVHIAHAHRKLVIIGTLAILLTGGALLQKTVLPRFAQARGGADNSTMFRVYTWRGTLHMAQARPLLGWGPGSYPAAYPQFAITGYTRTAHQVWLQLASESGFPAAILLFSACGIGAVYGWRALKTCPDWPVAAGATGAVVAFIAHGCTDAGWSILSIALLLMVTLSLLDSLLGEASLETKASGAINFAWLLSALPFALFTAWHQRIIQGEDLAAKSREMLTKGAPESALQTAREATQSDPLSARLWHNLGRIEVAAGQRGESAFLQALTLQPTKASHYIFVAQALGTREKARGYFDSAIWFDPNDTGIRLTRAEYLMSQKTSEAQKIAWHDYEYVAALYNAPYGKYPAVAEMVNLDFPRAFLKLGERALGADQKQRALKYAQRGLEVIALWHANEARNRQIAEGSGGAESFTRETRDVAELETQLNNLKERSQ